MAEDRISTDPTALEKEAGLGQEDEKRNPSEAILRHGLDADEALKAFIGLEGEQLVLDEDTNRKLLRKIDWNIIPVSSEVPELRSCQLTLVAYVRCIRLELPGQ